MGELTLGLKAYWVEEVDAEWGMFLHAENMPMAKYAFTKAYPGTETPIWTDLRVRRCQHPLLDIVPFTDAALRIAGYPVPAPGNELYDEHITDGFLDFCCCPICTAEKAKGKNIVLSTDLGMGGNEIKLTLVPVKKEVA